MFPTCIFCSLVGGGGGDRSGGGGGGGGVEFYLYHFLHSNPSTNSCIYLRDELSDL